MGYMRMSITKIKTGQQISHANDHNKRIRNCENADAELSHKNKELVVRDESYDDFIKRRISETNRYGRGKQGLRKDAVKAIELCFGFPHKDLKDNPFMDIDRFCEISKEWVAERFGEENIAGMTLHMDEATPHIHAVVVPITKDGRLCAAEIIGGPTGLRDMQTEISTRMEPLGLRRGLKRSVAKAGVIREFYASVEQAAVAALPKPNQGESLEQYVVRANSVFTTARMQHLQELNEMTRARDEARTIVKQLSGHTDDQMLEQEQRERELAQLKKQLAQHSKALEQWKNIVFCIQHNLLPEKDKKTLLHLMDAAVSKGAQGRAEELANKATAGKDVK